jgi:hypothetical protein
MRKLLRIVLITLGVILLILLLTPVIFKSRIEATVKEKVNEQIHAKLDWTGFSLSFFRGFPQLSISLHQLSVVGLEPFEGDTLAGLERFELRVNPFSALRRNLEVKSILIDRPLIHGIVLEDGSANWDIAPTEEEEVKEETSGPGSPMGVSLKRVAIRQGRIYYSDQASSMDASLEGLNLELKGDLSAAQSEIYLSTGVNRMNLKMGGIRYLRDAVFQLELQAAADLVENRFTLEKNLVSLNGLELGAEGDVLLKEGGDMVMDLTLFSRETSFKTLLSLVPAVYLQGFESVETSGNLQLDARITGIMNDSVFPDAQLSLLVADGYFSYPDLPKDVSDIQISLTVDYKGADMDASQVELEQFHFLLGGNPFDLNMLVDHPQSDMHVAGKANGIIDFSTLKDVVPMEEVNLEGTLETDLRWDTKLSYIEQENYDQVDMEGFLRMDGLTLRSPDLQVPVSLQNLNMQFNPRKVELSSLDAYLGSSDLHLSGDLQNFIPYVFEGQTLRGSLQVSSSLLDANELLVSEEADQGPEPAAGQDSIVPVRPDSLARPASLKIPENLDLALTLDMQRLTYEDIVVENLEGSVRVLGGVAGLENLRMEVIEGVVNTRGWVDTRGDFPEADVTLDMEGVDIPTAYKTFVSVEKLMPMAKYCRGKANITMGYHSFLDQSFVPLYESIDASGRVETRGLQFYNFNDFVPLSEVLKNEKFSNMAPDEVNVGFTMREGRIILDPFDMYVEDSRITVSGSHGIDLTMDYKLDMRIAKADLGTGANELMQGLTTLAAGAGIQIPASDYLNVVARITGTFNHPRVATDLSGNLKSSGENAITSVGERITREAEQVESEVREDASAEAEKIIADAEAEAARLVEEARKAGEKLVQEAEKQGDQLIKEAGNNPLKQVAARTAANELKKQAEQKSEKLVSEAEGKAAELIRKAREEAGRI